MREIDSQKTTIATLLRGQTFPSRENQEAKKTNFDSFLEDAVKVRDLVMAYRPPELKNGSVAQFTANFDRVENGLRKLFEKKNIKLPGKWHVGFEQYRTSTVAEGNTGILTYEMAAFENLFEAVAESGVSEVVNFYRELLPPEEGKPWPGEATQKEARGKVRGRANKNQHRLRNREQVAPVAKVLPFELIVKGRESAIRKLLSAISSDQKYFYVIRAIRVQNANIEPPSRADASFRDKPVGGGGFVEEFFEDENVIVASENNSGYGAKEASEENDMGSDSNPDPEENLAANKPLNTGRILEVVAGGEELYVFVRGEVILSEQIDLPQVQQNK